MRAIVHVYSLASLLLHFCLGKDKFLMSLFFAFYVHPFLGSLEKDSSPILKFWNKIFVDVDVEEI